MYKKLTIFFAIVNIILIILAIFVVNRKSSFPEYDTKEYENTITSLNDSIEKLRTYIVSYENAIETLYNERSSLKEELALIIKDNEKIDIELSNGDWDYNISYLTEYLSKEDSSGE